MTTLVINERPAGGWYGNAVGKINDQSGTLQGLVWNSGDRLVLRWLDANSLGADPGIAINRFTFWIFAPVPEPATWALCGGGFALFVAARRRKRNLS